MTQALVSSEQGIDARERTESEDICGIRGNHDKHWGGLIAALEQVQAHYGYLPEDALRSLAEKMNRSLVDVYSVATFYRSFHLQPRGKHLITVCLGTACHVRGAPRIAEEFERQLRIHAGQTTPDKEFTLETVNCLGACALGPVAVIDGRYFSKVRKSRVKQLIEDTLEGGDNTDPQHDGRIFPIEVACPRCNHSLMDDSVAIDGRSSIRLTASFASKHGWLRLSSLYGSYNIMAEHSIPQGTVVSLLCPHCHAELTGFPECPMCGSPMVAMLVGRGGMVRICSRRGCKNHMLDLV
jgi:NADH-quinone oxidoreductase subunit E